MINITLNILDNVMQLLNTSEKTILYFNSRVESLKFNRSWRRAKVGIRFGTQSTRAWKLSEGCATDFRGSADFN